MYSSLLLGEPRALALPKLAPPHSLLFLESSVHCWTVQELPSADFPQATLMHYYNSVSDEHQILKAHTMTPIGSAIPLHYYLKAHTSLGSTASYWLLPSHLSLFDKTKLLRPSRSSGLLSESLFSLWESQLETSLMNKPQSPHTHTHSRRHEHTR